ncbi:di-trans,poly-cis-decaprenylcistransferase [Candidatus Roizmanbacteria bacterium]|nr:di-trans,poly-cis-decaprenylcistransferase [Candidatus Roizmanbacteria bacterium]
MTPLHVAIIPDGNRRWAKHHGLPAFEGHRRGFNRALEIVKKSRELGIRTLTFWAFSTENWKRDKTEVENLMRLFYTMINRFFKEARKNEIRIIHIGRKDRISARLRSRIADIENKTKGFSRYYLVLALDYGGHDEILRAVHQIRKIDGQVDEKNFNSFLDTKALPHPNPDLIIRTSNEMRLSGFMSWQSAYAEFLFSKKLFPDFSPDDLTACIKEYQKRKRRFGR